MEDIPGMIYDYPMCDIPGYIMASLQISYQCAGTYRLQRDYTSFSRAYLIGICIAGLVLIYLGFHRVKCGYIMANYEHKHIIMMNFEMSAFKNKSFDI